MYTRSPGFGQLWSEAIAEMVRSTRKVVGGVPVPDDDVVRLTPEEQNAVGAFLSDDGRALCTATAITPRVVLSAAHCGAVRPGMRFAAGRDLRSPEFSARVVAVRRHPDYRYGLGQADVLLAYLDRDAPAAIGLGGPPAVGSFVQTVGYGRTAADEPGNMLRWWLKERVRELLPEDFAVWASGQHGLCLGDSGGPALISESGKPVVVGTVSWGEGDCTGTDVFKRVDVFAPWIRATIAEWEKSPPRPEVKRAMAGWFVGLLLAGVGVGLVLRGVR